MPFIQDVVRICQLINRRVIDWRVRRHLNWQSWQNIRHSVCGCIDNCAIWIHTNKLVSRNGWVQLWFGCWISRHGRVGVTLIDKGTCSSRTQWCETFIVSVALGIFTLNQVVNCGDNFRLREVNRHCIFNIWRHNNCRWCRLRLRICYRWRLTVPWITTGNVFNVWEVNCLIGYTSHHNVRCTISRVLNWLISNRLQSNQLRIDWLLLVSCRISVRKEHLHRIRQSFIRNCISRIRICCCSWNQNVWQLVNWRLVVVWLTVNNLAWGISNLNWVTSYIIWRHNIVNGIRIYRLRCRTILNLLRVWRWQPLNSRRHRLLVRYQVKVNHLCLGCIINCVKVRIVR